MCTFAFELVAIIEISYILALFSFVVFPGKNAMDFSAFVEIAMERVTLAFLSSHPMELVVLEEAFIIEIS